MKKLLSFLLCGIIVLSAASCSKKNSDDPQITTKAPEAAVQLSYDEQMALYDGIIAEYTELLKSVKNGKELAAPDTSGMSEREADIATALYGIVDEYSNPDYIERLGYGYRDLDENGTPELIILTSYTSLRAIFTISNNEPVLLEANYSRLSTFVFTGRNSFVMSRRNETDTTEGMTYYDCHVEGDKMVYDAVYGAVYDKESREVIERFQMIDGERKAIDGAAFAELNREYASITSNTSYYYTSKLYSPKINLPLVEKSPDKDLPVADFSSYEKILETYRAISTSFEDFSYEKWAQSVYDNAFSFPDERSFEYYTRLVCVAYSLSAKEGYDEIDLNGDGTDELLLMNEDYRITAIFTKKNGVPVLLESADDSGMFCWIDAEGKIHVDHVEYYTLEYSLYDFTLEGEFDLLYSIFISEKGECYLTKDGKTERITGEQASEIYHDDYCRYSEPFEPNEETRNTTKLEFTPLFESDKSLVESAALNTWYKNADLEETSGNEWGAYGLTYINLKNVTDTQLDVNVTYKYCLNYVDPEDEYNLLQNITESTFEFTAKAADGAYTFESQGVKGRIELGEKHIWLIIDQSTDDRFAVGHHCLEIDKSIEAY